VEFAQGLAQELRDLGLRVDVDDSTESVGKKIRNAEQGKLPLMLVVGDKEASGGPLTVRLRGEKDQQLLAKEAFVAMAQQRVQEKSL
jgi:threonyl-tRNA synthetase